MSKKMSNPEVTKGNGLGCDARWLFILGVKLLVPFHQGKGTRRRQIHFTVSSH